MSPGHRKQGQMASFYLKPPNINNVILKIELFLPYEFSLFEGGFIPFEEGENSSSLISVPL